MGSLGYPAWWRRFALVFFPAHFIFIAMTRGAGIEHLMADGFGVVLVLLPGRPSAFAWLVLPVWMTGAFYEWFPAVKSLRPNIHVADLYYSELEWFGCDLGTWEGIWPDYFMMHNHPMLDFFTGSAYALYIYQIPLMAIYLIFKDSDRLGALAWSVFAVHMAGMMMWVIYPAAPPWYVQLYGLGPADLTTPPNPAGALRFDTLLGIDYFSSFYSKSQNVFGAMPSLHAAYPTVVLLNMWTYRRRAWRWGCLVFTLLMSFAAVYLQHHYVWDVLVGWALAVAGCLLVFALRQLRKPPLPTELPSA